MLNTEMPLDLEQQVQNIKRYVNCRNSKRIREFLRYIGYFRASRYGKYLLSKTNVFKSRADIDIFFSLYEFDSSLRQLLFKYCVKAEIYIKSSISNSVSLKTGDAGFYLDKQWYTPSKSARDKKTRKKNINFFEKNYFPELKKKEKELRCNVVKHPELKDYRKGGTKNKNVLPVWAAFTYFEMGTIVMMYSYLRGDLRKEVLTYAYLDNNYKKEVTKQVDTWLDAIRNLRNYCAHHSMVVGMTSSVVISDCRDDERLLPNDTNLYSRLYALKKILPCKEADALGIELERLIKKSRIEVYKMDILPHDWKEMYDKVCYL